MVLFRVLDQKHQSYNADQIKRLRLLYEGGYSVQENSNLFLKKLNCETQPAYDDRLRSAAYHPYLSQTIDYFTSMLFKSEITVDAANGQTSNTGVQKLDDIYRSFLGSADLSGNSLEKCLWNTTQEALTFSNGFLGIDFPLSPSNPPSSLLEEEDNNLSTPYIYYIEPECVIDYQLADNNHFSWIKLKRDILLQETPLSPKKHIISFKIWTLQNGFAHWETYQTELLDLKKQPNPSADLPLHQSSSTSFKSIPIYHLSIPAGLAIGTKLGPMCEQYFQNDSIISNAINKALTPMRIVFLGDETAAPGGPTTSQVQENPFRHLSLNQDWESRGFGVLGANDRAEVLEAEGKALAIAHEQNAKLAQSIKEVVHQMANSVAHNSHASASASSKQEDRHAAEMLLTAYGSIVRDFIKKIMTCISEARGDSISWSVGGLDNFSVVDREQLIKEAKQFIDVVSNSVSPTFRKLYTEKLYTALIDGASQEEALQIHDEIARSLEPSPQAHVSVAEKLPSENAAN